MTKKEFISKLEKNISSIGKSETKRYIAYFSECIDDRIEDGMTEEQAVSDIGSIDAVIEEILNQSKNTCTTNTESNMLKRIEFTSEKKCVKIVVRESNAPIDIIKSGDSLIHITYFENKQHKYSIEMNEGVIELIYNPQKEWFSYIFNFDNFKRSTVIALPEGFEGSLYIKNSNAHINVNDVSFKGGELRSSNSVINVEKAFSADNLLLGTSNSRISSNIVNVNGEIRCETTNGQIRIKETLAKDIVAFTSNGAVNLERSCTSSGIQVRSSNGAISFDSLSFEKSLSVTTSNGRITGNLLGPATDYTIRSNTSNGANNLRERDGGEKLVTLRTSNGSIKVDII